MLLFIDFCTCSWLIPWILPFLLGLLLGWLIWGRLRGRIEELEAENAQLKSNIKSLEGQLNDCHSSKAGLDSEISLLQGRLREAEATIKLGFIGDAGDSGNVTQSSGFVGGDAVVEETASKVVEESGSTDSDIHSIDITPGKSSTEARGIKSSIGGKKDAFLAIEPDNLQVVEGIGPKMNEVLNNSGVSTWAQLAAKTPGELRGTLDAANAKRYRIIDPSTWPDQARLANNGDWDELIQMQKNLDTGRAQGAKGETDSKVEKLLIKMGVLKRWKQDDLTAIEGIGPKISGLLHDAAIKTWRALANTDVSKLQSILDEAGKRYQLADPGSWPKQAEMAADGRWDDLQEYQDFLQSGK